ncbi:MAG: hypothetical protein CMJ62_20220 [Planctomycetaceae bacterium]|nr:hypothetical protein [Planctomycetaceae bacterium]
METIHITSEESKPSHPFSQTSESSLPDFGLRSTWLKLANPVLSLTHRLAVVWAILEFPKVL